MKINGENANNDAHNPPTSPSKDERSKGRFPSFIGLLKALALGILFVIIGFVELLALLLFCYRPGSTQIDDIVVRGRIVAADGSPLVNEKVDVFFPATYGLAVSEMSTPSRFGNHPKMFRTKTDSNGEFSLSFGPIAYHVDFYYLPFHHVRIPDRPPSLHFVIRVPAKSLSDYYVIRAREGTYTAWSDDKHERASDTSPAVSIAVREELHGELRVTQIVGVAELTYGGLTDPSEDEGAAVTASEDSPGSVTSPSPAAPHPRS